MTTATEVRLTPPQEILLYVLLSEGSRRVDESYRPGLALVEKGMATSEPAKYGGSVLTLTNAGRERATRTWPRHRWMAYRGMTTCEVCNVVRNDGNGEKACRGHVRVTLR